MIRDDFVKKLYLTLKNKHCLMGSNIAIGVSGGMDSMALLTAISMLKESPLLSNVQCSVVTIDHGIRKESEEEVQFVKYYANRLGFEALSFKLSPQRKSEHYLHRLRKGIWLKVLSEYGIDKIWLAHHADDVIEHLLLQLLRGEEIRGLTSMKECDFYIGRPLIYFTKAEIKEFVKRHNVPYFEDLTNYDISVPRNFLRHEIIPKLKERFNISNVMRSYKVLRIQRRALESCVDDIAQKHVKINGKVMIIQKDWAVSVEIALSLLRSWGEMPPAKIIDRILELELKHPGSSVSWKNIRFIRLKDGIKVVRGD